MTGATCLDSSVIVAHLRGDAAMTERIRSVGARKLSCFAYAELIVGTRLSFRSVENRAALDQFVGACELLFPDHRTLEVFSDLKVRLRQAGTPIPEGDLWIAALAVQHDWPLAFCDKHYDVVPDLKKLPWEKAPRV